MNFHERWPEHRQHERATLITLLIEQQLQVCFVLTSCSFPAQFHLACWTQTWWPLSLDFKLACCSRLPRVLDSCSVKWRQVKLGLATQLQFHRGSEGGAVTVTNPINGMKMQYW